MWVLYLYARDVCVYVSPLPVCMRCVCVCESSTCMHEMCVYVSPLPVCMRCVYICESSTCMHEMCVQVHMWVLYTCMQEMCVYVSPLYLYAWDVSAQAHIFHSCHKKAAHQQDQSSHLKNRKIRFNLLATAIFPSLAKYRSYINPNRVQHHWTRANSPQDKNFLLLLSDAQIFHLNLLFV